jgi:hypothetical protein
MKVLLALFAIAISACASTPRNPQAWMEREINACLPTAIAFREGLQTYDVWAEVLVTRWTDLKGQLRGHAYTAYLYPPGSNQLWTYDALGSYRTRAYTNAPASVAWNANHFRNYGTKNLTAEYLQ